MKSIKITCAISLTLALSACGGGDGSSTPSTPTTYNVSGNVTGSPTSGLVLQLNGGTPLPVSAQGFAWSNVLINGQAYSVTVSAQPTGSTCTVSNGSGTISSANVTNVTVNCAAIPALSLFTGNMGGPGYLNGSIANARFNNPIGIGIDDAGNIYVTDRFNNAVRKITPNGVVSTLATLPTYALAYTTNAIAVDGAGDVFICGYANNPIETPNIYKINASGINVMAPYGCDEGTLTVDKAGDVYIRYATSIFEFTLTGTSSTVAIPSGSDQAITSMLNMTVDNAGNIYGDGEGLIQKLTPSGVLTTLAGSGISSVSKDGTGTAATFANPGAIAVDGNGTLYVIDGQTIRKITPAGVVTTLAGTAGMRGSADGTGAAASFLELAGITVDNQENVYLVDVGNNNIRKITPAGVVTTVTGSAIVSGSSDGLGAAANFNSPEGITTDSAGNVYVADSGNFTIRKITPAGQTSTFAGSPGFSGNINGTGAAARFGGAINLYGTNFSFGPQGLAIDSIGNLYVADPVNLNIREISSSGVVSTFAGPGAPGSLGAAVFYWFPFTCPPSPDVRCTPNTTYGPALGAYGVAINSMGNFYVADTYAGTMSTITPAGAVTTLGGAINPNANTHAATFTQPPQSIVTDSASNAYVAGGTEILKVTPAGVVSTFAGGSSTGSTDGVGTAASFKSLTGIAIDASGNLYVADSGNCTIRKITPAAVVSTVVGVAGQCGFVPGALPALLSSPNNLTLNGRTLYITTANGVAVVNNVP